MSFGRLCIAAALFFAATYIHVFVPLWAQAAREPLLDVLDRQGFALTAEEQEGIEILWLNGHE